MRTFSPDRLHDALTWFDANRDGTREGFQRRFKRAADQLLTACLSQGYLAPRGRHYEITIPGARRLYDIRSRE
ncbi:hypothetical protein [Arenimonas alkanexedens]